LPEPGFLQELRALCDRDGTLLIFDEVMTGFRLAPCGAQEIYCITPDLTAMGKVIGGGLPVGAFGGRAEIMDHLSPDGPVYQAGTLSGNPVAMAAGLAQLRELIQRGGWSHLEDIGREFEDRVRSDERRLRETLAKPSLQPCGIVAERHLADAPPGGGHQDMAKHAGAHRMPDGFGPSPGPERARRHTVHRGSIFVEAAGRADVHYRLQVPPLSGTGSRPVRK
jgi:hypothetical protein